MKRGVVNFSNINPISCFDNVSDANNSSDENSISSNESNSANLTEVVQDNILEPKLNKGSLKKGKKTYKYKAIFDKSLEDHKAFKKPGLIYEHNMKRIQVLHQLNPDVNLTEIINYIINDFFSVNSEEIKLENKIYMSEINDTF